MKKLSYEFDPWEITGVDKPKSVDNREQAQEEVADYLLEEALSYIGDAESPVSNGKWKKSLSPEYAKIKAKISGSTVANMELYGDMLDALEVKVKRGGKLEYGIFDSEEANKADGHNNISGKSKLPPREFIPKEDGNFRRDIVSGIRDILKEYEDDGES